MKILDRDGFFTGIVYIVLGTGFAAASLAHPLGSLVAMGAGYFPLLASVALALTGIALAARAVRRDAVVTTIEPRSWRPALFIAAGVTAFGFLIKSAGLAIAIPALMVLLALAQPDFSPRRLLAAIVVLLPLAWLIFVELLGLPVPIMPVGLGG